MWCVECSQLESALLTIQHMFFTPNLSTLLPHHLTLLSSRVKRKLQRQNKTHKCTQSVEVLKIRVKDVLKLLVNVNCSVCMERLVEKEKKCCQWKDKFELNNYLNIDLEFTDEFK